MKLTNEKIGELDTLVLKLSKKLSNVSYVEDVLKKSGLEYKEYSLAVHIQPFAYCFRNFRHIFLKKNLNWLLINIWKKLIILLKQMG